MSNRPLAAIILAAGQGTRMKSDIHKVLHPIAGKPMLHHIVDNVTAMGAEKIIIVVGAKREQVEKSLSGRDNIAFVEQTEQLGTGHAVLQAKEALEGFAGDVLVLFGDVPLIRQQSMTALVDRLHAADQPRCVMLGFRPDDPAAYGRIIATPQGMIEKMVEFKDASPEERAVDLCNAGPVAARGAELFLLLEQITNDNVQGEYYLPDIVMLPGGQSAVYETDDPREVAGVNSRAQLAEVEGYWQAQKREDIMADGVTLVAPDTVFFAHDTKIGRDTVVEPNVIFGAGVTIGENAAIKGHSHIEGATIADHCAIGPFARLRPGAVLGEGAKIGNFVEMKKATMGAGAKASHLTYLGDATIGENANIGAGTICCNYDGYFKYQTIIGKDVFVGSNSALVAPVSIGDGAMVAAGSVVTQNVTKDSLVLVRAQQKEKAGWAAKFRELMAKRKEKS